MLYSLYFIPHRIAELNGIKLTKNGSTSSLRSKLKILVIDDDVFPFVEELKRMGFDLYTKKDLEDLIDAQPYSIILCDIHGVGKRIPSSNEGAYLAQQIKKQYPEKYVITFSEDRAEMKAQKYFKSVDKTMPKSAAFEDWVEVLDEAIDCLLDPVLVWKNTSLRLIEAKVATIEIAKMESKFVSYVKKNEYNSILRLAEKYEEVISIISGFVKLALILMGK